MKNKIIGSVFSKMRRGLWRWK